MSTASEQEPMGFRNQSCGPSTMKPKTASHRAVLKISAAVPSRRLRACARLDKALGFVTGDDATVRARGPTTDQDVWELYYLPDDFSQVKTGSSRASLTRSPSSPSCGGRRPNETGCCRWAGSQAGDLPPCPPPHGSAFSDVQNIQRGMVPVSAVSTRRGTAAHPRRRRVGVIVANADFSWEVRAGSTNSGTRTTYPFLGVETYRQVFSEPPPPGCHGADAA